jgi:hypothetical protein
MKATSPHLALEDLAARGSCGLSAAAARHLEECAACRARSRAVAADGVRFLVTRCQLPPSLIDQVLADIDERATAGMTRKAARRHRPRLAPRLVAGVAAALIAGAGLVLGLTGVLGAAPARSTGTIRTAAFTLTRNADGTRTLTLRQGQMFDAAVLQRALAHDGIRALVKTGTYCSSSPAAPEPGSIGVLTYEFPDRTPVPKPPAIKTGHSDHFVTADLLMVINPAKMPSGTELFFSYFGSDRGLFSSLIYTRSYTCSTGPQPPAP